MAQELNRRAAITRRAFLTRASIGLVAASVLSLLVKKPFALTGRTPSLKDLPGEGSIFQSRDGVLPPR